MKKLNKKGFTIVELVIVIAVIAILAAVLIPTFSGVVNKANDSARTQEMTNALKVVLAGNAGTGALAEDTIFVTKDGYYAVYNGNKLGDITLLEDGKADVAATDVTYIDWTGVAGTPSESLKVMIGIGDSAKSIEIKSIIVSVDNGLVVEASKNSVKAFFGTNATLDWTNSDVTITKSDKVLKLKLVSNVDLAKGMYVLSPTAVK